jgi:hypothetical protein
MADGDRNRLEARMKWLMLSVAVLLALTPSGFAQLGTTKTGDSRIRAALDELELEYTVDKDGDFKLTFSFDDDRTQLLYINSGTETFKQLEIREVWSPAHKSSSAFSATLANKLLVDSQKRKIGAWSTMKYDDGSHLAIFVAKIDANADAQSLHAVIKAVVTTADAMEEDLTGTRDEY